MRRTAILSLLWLWCACAERQPLPPGDELEKPEPAPVAVVVDAGTSEMPARTDGELAKAWEPPPSPGVAKPTAPPPSPDDEEAVERTLSAQAEAEARAKLKELLVGGRRSLSAKKLDDAQTISEGALDLATGLGPNEAQAAIELASKVAVARGDVAAAVKHAEKWIKL